MNDQQEDSDKKIRAVVRIGKPLYDRIRKIADKRRMTTTSAIERAIKLFLEEEEHSFESLIELIDQQPTLKLNRELILKVFKDTEEDDAEALADVIDFIKRRNNTQFYDFPLAELEKKIEEINKEDCWEVLFIARVNPKHREVGRFKKIMNQIEEVKCRHDLHILFDTSISEEFSFLAFVLPKKESENGK